MRRQQKLSASLALIDTFQLKSPGRETNPTETEKKKVVARDARCLRLSCLAYSSEEYPLLQPYESPSRMDRQYDGAAVGV